MVLDGLHLLATGVWAGGLVPLVPRVSRWTRRASPVRPPLPEPPSALLPLGLGAVSVLVLTGAYAAWQQVGGGTRRSSERRTGAGSSLKLALFRRPPAAWPRGTSSSGVAGSRRGGIGRRRCHGCASAERRPGGRADRGDPRRGGGHRAHDPGAARARSVATVLPVRLGGDQGPSRRPAARRDRKPGGDAGTGGAPPGAGDPAAAMASRGAWAAAWRSRWAPSLRFIRWRSTRIPRPTCGRRFPTRPRRSSGRAALPGALPGLSRGWPVTATAPARRGLPRPLRTSRPSTPPITTAGDLFWWLTRGIPGPGCQASLSRFQPRRGGIVINFVRALGRRRADAGPRSGRHHAPRRSWPPDFTFTTGVGEGRAAGTGAAAGWLLLVFFTAPRVLPIGWWS